MRVRAQDAAGDYQFGRSDLFLVDTPAAVAQVIRNRLSLQTGEWFLDLTEGTPYAEFVLGYGTQGTRDQALQSRILDTPGVQELQSYASSVTDRRLTVTATVITTFGAVTITSNIN